MVKIDKMLYVEIGNKLRKAREEKRISLEQVADAVGVTKKTIQRYETAESRISTAMLKKICDVLDIDADSISDYFVFRFQNNLDDEVNTDVKHVSLKSVEAKQNFKDYAEFDDATDALKFILEQPIFASNVGYDPKKMTDEQLIKLANRILRFARMEVEDIEYVDLDELDALDDED